MRIRALFAALLFLAFSGSIAGAATSVPYQKYINGSCPNLICNINFPVVPAGKRLEITSTSCYLRTSSTADFFGLQLLVVTPSNVILNAVTLPTRFADSSETYRHYTGASETFAFALGGQRFRAFAQLTSGAFLQFACHISGHLITP